LAIEARGFGYNIRKRTSIRTIKYDTIDYILTVIFVFLVIFAIVTGQWGLNLGNYMITKSLIRQFFFTF